MEVIFVVAFIIANPSPSDQYFNISKVSGVADPVLYAATVKVNKRDLFRNEKKRSSHV
jgi:hypothetical protein